MSGDHGHDHEQSGTVKPMVDEITEFEVLEIALRELCIEKGLFTAEQHRHFTEFAEHIGPTPAARLVAKAGWTPISSNWCSPIRSPHAIRSAWTGWPPPDSHPQRLRRVQGAGRYPRGAPRHRLRAVLLLTRGPILGNSPEWYRTPNYRRRIVRWPRQVLSEFGLELPEGVEVRVEDSNQKHRFMVMPLRPEGTDGWTEDQLAEILTRTASSA
jgi:nitrile hydratase